MIGHATPVEESCVHHSGIENGDPDCGAGQLDPRPVITHRFPLESIAEAIQVIKDGQAGKVILEVGT